MTKKYGLRIENYGEKMDLDNYEKIFLISINSLLGLFFSLFLYVAFNDYFFVPMYSIMQDLQTNGIIGSWVLTVFETFIENAASILMIIDYVWFGAFALVVFNIWRKSYFARRKGYWDVFGFLSFGVLIFMFISSIFETITNYLYDVFFNGILQNLMQNLVFFDFYIANYSLINLLIVIIAVILNIIDLDLSTFMNRKQKENLEDGGQLQQL